MSRSSLRHVRRRAQRKVRVGITIRRLDGAFESFAQAIKDWAEGVQRAGESWARAMHRGLKYAALDLLRPLIRRWVDSVYPGVDAPRFDQQHGDADDAPQ